MTGGGGCTRLVLASSRCTIDQAFLQSRAGHDQSSSHRSGKGSDQHQEAYRKQKPKQRSLPSLFSCHERLDPHTNHPALMHGCLPARRCRWWRKLTLLAYACAARDHLSPSPIAAPNSRWVLRFHHHRCQHVPVLNLPRGTMVQRYGQTGRIVRVGGAVRPLLYTHRIIYFSRLYNCCQCTYSYLELIC